MRKRRGGSMFLETAMAVALGAVAMIAIAQLLAVAAGQLREGQWRSLATREAANLMEKVMVRSWNELSTAELQSLQLSYEGARRLPAARRQIEVVDAGGSLKSKQIRIRIDWQNSSGRRGEAVELFAWRFQAGEHP